MDASMNKRIDSNTCSHPRELANIYTDLTQTYIPSKYKNLFSSVSIGNSRQQELLL